MTSALLTDLYQLSMAQGYFHCGRQDDTAVFHLYFRRLPFRGGYAVAAGLEQALEYIEEFRFTREDVDYLASLRGADNSPLFTPPFDPTRQRVMPTELVHEDLLKPVVRAGKPVATPTTLVQLQQHTRQELERFDPAVRRLVNPHEYPVGLSEPLYAERLRLIQEARSARRRA